MTAQRRRAVQAALAASLFAFVPLACSSSKSGSTASGCDAVKMDCPNEPTATLAALRDECRSGEADPTCGAQYEALFECEQRSQVCDGDGRYDPDSTEAKCQAELEAFHACGAPDAAPDEGVDTARDASPDTRADAGADVADAKSDAKTDAKSDVAPSD